MTPGEQILAAIIFAAIGRFETVWYMRALCFLISAIWFGLAIYTLGELQAALDAAAIGQSI